MLVVLAAARSRRDFCDDVLVVAVVAVGVDSVAVPLVVVVSAVFDFVALPGSSLALAEPFFVFRLLAFSVELFWSAVAVSVVSFLLLRLLDFAVELLWSVPVVLAVSF